MNLSNQCLTYGFHANAIERHDGSANSHELQNDHMDVKDINDEISEKVKHESKMRIAQL